jgi:hypothetical protein
VTLVPDDSPLRRVPSNLERRTILYLDGIRFALEQFDLASLRLADALNEIAKSGDDAKGLNQLVAQATIDAWSLVDAAHRLRQLLQQLPGLKKNQADVKLFLRRTASVEELRHFVQHFRNEIDVFAKRGMPLCGTLSWVWSNEAQRRIENHTIIPGTFFEGAWVATCTFDTKRFQFVERVLLHAGSVKIDLADLNNFVEQFTKWYVDWFLRSFGSLEHNAADIHLMLNVKPVLRSKSDDSAENDAA